MTQPSLIILDGTTQAQRRQESAPNHTAHRRQGHPRTLAPAGRMVGFPPQPPLSLAPENGEDWEGAPRPLSRAAPQLSSGPACFTCSYHHCVVLGLRVSLGFPVSLSPSSAGRGPQGPAEPSATCSHFCLVLDQ